MAAEYFSCHSFSKVLVKQHSCDLELSCIFGNVRRNVWMGPLGMLRRSCVFLSAFQRANILLHLRTYSCEILGSWNSLLIRPVPLLGEVFFSQASACCNLGTLFPAWVFGGLTHKGCEGWGVASAEMPLGNMILLWVLRIYSSLKLLKKGMFMENPSLIWDSGSYSVKISLRHGARTLKFLVTPHLS